MTQFIAEYKDTIGTLLSLILAIASYLSFRAGQLRKEELSIWAKDCIAEMQRLSQVLHMARNEFTAPPTREQLAEVAIRLSVLCDQGRIFFKNFKHKSGRLKDHGSDKPPAFQGIRPRILDCLLAGYQAAVSWSDAEAKQQDLISKAVYDECREFVSLAQKEVGRNRAISADASAPGKGEPLAKAIVRVEKREAEKAKMRAPKSPTSGG